MSRQIMLNREQVREAWLESSGKIRIYKLAKLAAVHPNTIGRWKKEDDWQTLLKDYIPRKKSGGQEGNRNAKGHGAPKGNKNAEKHGAYSSVRLDNLPEEERSYIELLDITHHENLLAEYNRELQLLYAKEADIARKIRMLEAQEEATILDRRTTYKNENVSEADGDTEKEPEKQSVSESFVNKQQYLNALYTEHSRVHGRIVRHLDAIRTYHTDQERLELEQRKHNLNKQRVLGGIRINIETGDIIDDDLEDE